MTLRKILLSFALTFTLTVASAYEPGYIFHFNIDENLSGSEIPIPDAGWNLHYGPTATSIVPGDGSIVSGVSEGGTGNIPKPLEQFNNNDRGFIFGSGTGDATTGFAPQAMLFWTTNLTTVSSLQGGKASGSNQTDWMTPSFPATDPLNTIALKDLMELSLQTLPRNLATVYRIAFQVGGTWYVEATGHTNSGFSWENYSVIIPTAQLYPLPFTPGVELDIDVTDNALTSVAALDQSTPITGYGIYVDTGEAKGSQNNTGSWARGDAFYIKALNAPNIQTVAVNGSTFSADVDTVTGATYQLLRDTSLNGTFSTTIGTPTSGTGSTVTLDDLGYGALEVDNVFYKVDAKIESVVP